MCEMELPVSALGKLSLWAAGTATCSQPDNKIGRQGTAGPTT